jgi:signal transduction histidine kinase/putative methionine-R-sulfoxide reductase with GAF domain
MHATDPKLSRTVRRIAGAAALIISISLPLGYYLIGHRYQVGMLDAQAEINARIASQVINTNPEMWRFMNNRLEDFLSRRPRLGYAEIRRIIDQENKVIAESADPLDSPTIVRSAELLDSGKVVGRIEIVRSLRPLLFRTSALALLSILLSWLAFVSLKVFPLRALDRALGDNRRLLEETQSIAEEQTALNSIATAASQTLEIHEMLQSALEQTLKVTNRTIGIVRLKDDASGRLRVIGHKGISQTYAAALDEERRFGKRAYEVMNDGAVHVIDNPAPAEIMDDSRAEGILSRIWVPIQAHGRILGVLTIASSTVQPFSAREIELLKAIGSIFGAAVANARLFEDTQKNLSRIQALREIDQAINSTLNLREVLDVLLERIEIFLPYASATTVRLFDKQSGTLVPITCRNLDVEEWKAKPWNVGRGSPNIVFDTEKPVTILDVRTDPRARNPEFFKKYDLVSYLGVPFVVHGETLGVLSLYTKERHAFSEQEIEFLSTLAGQGSIAIMNSQLYEKAERRRREAEELARLAQLLTETLDMAAIGECIVTSVRDIVGAKGAILRTRESNGSFRMLASSGELLSQNSFGEIVPLGLGLTSRAVEEKRSMWSGDILSDPDVVLSEPMREYHLRSGNGSVMVVLLRAHEKVIGTMTLFDRKGRVYSDNEVGLLQTFADQGALALENARLFADAKRKMEELEQKSFELERANKAKDEFLSIMSHELRTPLNVVVGYSAMVKEGMLGEINPKQEEALGKVLARTNDQLQMINSILQATQIKAGTVRVITEELDLSEFLDDIRSNYELRTDHKEDLVLQWTYSAEFPVIRTDGDKLKHTLQNLVDNAIKFTEKGRIEISVRHFENPNVIEFKVSDTGIGISKSKQAGIFEMFHQVDSSESRRFEGVGVGLYIVKKFTELIGGSIDVQSEEGKGSCFVVRIPADLTAERTQSGASTVRWLNDSHGDIFSQQG